MQKTATFAKDIENKLKQYREERFKQTGKRPFRETAIEELLAKALQGYEPPMPLEDRLQAIERKLVELELHQAVYITLPQNKPVGLLRTKLSSRTPEVKS